MAGKVAGAQWVPEVKKTLLLATSQHSEVASPRKREQGPHSSDSYSQRSNGCQEEEGRKA
jgi:hypothetical protein